MSYTRIWYAVATLAIAGCNPSVGYEAVSIRPTYGWEDGCTDVKISGHGFESDVSATIGGAAVENITLPDAGETPLDEGFLFYATTPAGTHGFASVEVKSGGETSEIPDAFYYLPCPAPVFPEALSQAEGIAKDTAVTVFGCNLDADGLRIEIRDPAGVQDPQTAELTSVCNTAITSFAAPDLPDGVYELYFVDVATGEDAYPVACDTSDTAAVCDPPFTFTYGGAK